MSDKLKFDDIKHLHSINNVDDELVLDLINSIMERGWQGCPILIYNGELLTGSHRLIALKNIAVLNPNEKVLQEYVAFDVTDIVNRRILELSDDEFEYGIDYSDLGLLFEGTEIEKYKDEIKEW